MPATPRRPYLSGLTDSTRWGSVSLRPDDILISTPSKCGTTWMQMICALLVFQRPDLPAPLTALSPWVDMHLRPLADLVEQLASMRHRRFLKTHTPLDGLPEQEGVRYVVGGRDLRDVALSMAHHRANLDPQVVAGAARTMELWPTVVDRFRGWVDDDRPPDESLSSLRGAVWHLRTAWDRRHDPAVVLVHHADLIAGLEAELRRLAGRLGCDVPEERYPELAAAAGFEAMRARASVLVPDERIGLLSDPAAFFRSGRPGAWRTEVPAAEVHRLEARLAALAPPDLVAWLQR